MCGEQSIIVRTMYDQPRPVLVQKLTRLFFLTVLLGCAHLAMAAPPAKGPITLAGVKAAIWGDYAIRPMLFPTEEWRFHVIVVPKEVRQGTLIKMAQDFHTKHPNTRARFFSDTTHLKQYVDRDRYMNDKTGKVKEVDFPKPEWVQDHLLGNINNRSRENGRQWMLEDRYGNRISSLP